MIVFILHVPLYKANKHEHQNYFMTLLQERPMLAIQVVLTGEMKGKKIIPRP